MTVHPEFAAMCAEAVKARNPKATQREIDLAVAGVAASEGFRDLAHFLTRDLAAGMYAQAIAAEAQKITAAAARVEGNTLAAVPATTSRPRNPASWLGQHYAEQAEPRDNIEAQALAARIAEGRATPLDILQQRPTPPTKAERLAADTPNINTADLRKIADPNKRHAAYRGRVADTRAVERLKLDQTAYTKKALDPATPPNIRAQANLELNRINERLKALGGE